MITGGFSGSGFGGCSDHVVHGGSKRRACARSARVLALREGNARRARAYRGNAVRLPVLGRYRVEIATGCAVDRLRLVVMQLLHGIYQLRTELTVRRSVLHKTPNSSLNRGSRAAPVCQNRCPIWASSPRKAAWRLAFVPTSWPSSAAPQPTCAARFWAAVSSRTRAATIAVGSMTVAARQSLAEGLVALLADKGIKARIMQRRSADMVYLMCGKRNSRVPRVRRCPSTCAAA